MTEIKMKKHFCSKPPILFRVRNFLQAHVISLKSSRKIEDISIFVCQGTDKSFKEFILPKNDVPENDNFNFDYDYNR